MPRISFFEVICGSNFSQGQEVNVLERPNECRVQWSTIIFRDEIELNLVAPNQIESIGKGKDTDKKGGHEILNIVQDLENDLDQGSNLLDKLEEVEALTPDNQSGERLHDSECFNEFLVSLENDD